MGGLPSEQEQYPLNTNNPEMMIEPRNKTSQVHSINQHKNITAINTQPNETVAKICYQHNQLPTIVTETIKAINLSQNSQNKRISIPSNKKIYFYWVNGATYQGSLQGGLPHGYGIVHYKDGSFYSGDFERGDPNGTGIYIYADGSVYEGGFKDSYYQGYGVLNYRLKRMRIVGFFVKGKPNGLCQEVYEDGEYFSGQFKNGIKHGKGIYRWHNQYEYDGQFKNGVMNGQGLITKNGKYVFKGQFKDNMKQSEGLFNGDNASYYGIFVKDLLQGPGTMVKKNEIINQGSFVHSRLQGRGHIYNMVNNEAMDVTWVNNVVDKIHRKFNCDQVRQKIEKIILRHKINQ